MSQSYGRFHNFVELDLPTLTRLTQPVFPGRKVITAQPLSHGHINTNYKLGLEDMAEPLVLRIYARGAEVCRKEAELYQLMQGRVPTAEMLWTDYSTTTFEKPFAVMRWVEGVPLNDLLESGQPEEVVQAGQAVGATLAAIGAFTFEQAGFFGPNLTIARPFGDGTLPDYVRQHLFEKDGAAKLGQDLAQRLWQLVQANATILDSLPQTNSLVHSDFNASNLLLTRQDDAWQVAAVLDWEWSHVWTGLFDMAVLLRHDDKLPPAFIPAFKKGFTDNGGLLPTNWRHVVKLLDLINLAEFFSRPNQPDLQADSRRVIARMLAEW